MFVGAEVCIQSGSRKGIIYDVLNAGFQISKSVTIFCVGLVSFVFFILGYILSDCLI